MDLEDLEIMVESGFPTHRNKIGWQKLLERFSVMHSRIDGNVVFQVVLYFENNRIDSKLG